MISRRDQLVPRRLSTGWIRGAGRGMRVADQFGRNLADCRRRAKLSQEELAVRASLHRTAVGQLERGERVARVDTVIKLAGSLGIHRKNCSTGWDGTPAGPSLAGHGGRGQGIGGMIGLGKRDQAGQSVKPSGRAASRARGQPPARSRWQAGRGQESRSGRIQTPISATTPEHRHTANPPVRCLGRTFLIHNISKALSGSRPSLRRPILARLRRAAAARMEARREP